MILAQAATMVGVLEAAMLICFGISWPVDILKCLRTRRTEGKSLAFMSIILFGYICGIGAKISKASLKGEQIETVTILYVLNLVLVAVDIGLYLHFSKLGRVASALEESEGASDV